MSAVTCVKKGMKYVTHATNTPDVSKQTFLLYGFPAILNSLLHLVLWQLKDQPQVRPTCLAQWWGTLTNISHNEVMHSVTKVMTAGMQGNLSVCFPNVGAHASLPINGILQDIQWSITHPSQGQLTDIDTVAMTAGVQGRNVCLLCYCKGPMQVCP